MFFFDRKRPQLGISSRLINSAVAVIWAACLLLIVPGLEIQCTAQTSPGTAIPSSPSTPVDSDKSGNSHQTSWKIDYPQPWSVESDGHAWVAASEVDKQLLAGAFAAASSQQHTALYFYTNLNELYDHFRDKLGDPVTLAFGALDRVSPASSYPTFQGFSWVRMGAKKLPQGDVKVVFIFWPNGSGSIHFQPLGSTIPIDQVSDSSWAGDLSTYKCTTTVSGSTYTMHITGPETRIESGAFQVSLDGQELEMAGPFHAPIRYALMARVVDSSKGTSTDTMVKAWSERLKLPQSWGAKSDGHTWEAASETDKQALATALSSASLQQHTSAFFYTNLNEQYDHAEMLNDPVFALFAALDQISPAKSYPTFQGYIWKRMDAVQTPPGIPPDKAAVFGLFWPDGHSFIHYQKLQNQEYAMGGDGPWPGDLVTYTNTTVISGNNYTILTTAPGIWTDTGTFQVSLDGRELEMARPGHVPIRYLRQMRLVHNMQEALKVLQQ